MAGVTKYFEVIAEEMKEIQSQGQTNASHNTLDEQNVQGILSCLENIQNQQDDIQEQLKNGKKWISSKLN